MKIAILGIQGSFHHQAAVEYFGKNIDLISCRNFKEILFHTEYNFQCEAGIIAINYTITGNIDSNRKLIRASSLNTIGHISIPIKQHLMALKGTHINELSEVHSHYIAINQCKPFLEKLGCKVIEKIDTAGCAREIKSKQLKSVGVIASEMAAEIYRLEILNKNIQSYKKNFTKFLILQKRSTILNTKPKIHQSPYLKLTNEI